MRRGSFTQHAKSTIALLSVLSVPQVGWAGAEDWSLQWTDNTMLPPVFRQAEIPRDDGSRATVFVADFDNGLTRRKGLLVYLDGSGTQSLLTVADGCTGVGMVGVLARVAAPHYHIAAAESASTRPSPAAGTPEASPHRAFGQKRALGRTLLIEPSLDPVQAQHGFLLPQFVADRRGAGHGPRWPRTRRVSQTHAAARCAPSPLSSHHTSGGSLPGPGAPAANRTSAPRRPHTNYTATQLCDFLLVTR